MPFTPSFSHTLGPLEREIMDVVWSLDRPVTVRDILDAVNAPR